MIRHAPEAGLNRSNERTEERHQADEQPDSAERNLWQGLCFQDPNTVARRFSK